MVWMSLASDMVEMGLCLSTYIKSRCYFMKQYLIKTGYWRQTEERRKTLPFDVTLSASPRVGFLPTVLPYFTLPLRRDADHIETARWNHQA